MDHPNTMDTINPLAPDAKSGYETTKPRWESIDLLRGIVMVIMALDHTRDFFMPLTISATDLSQTWGALFFTRWITHFCAPVFVFLAGTSAYLMQAKGKSKAELSKFLLTRGIWLVLLEVTVVRWTWLFNLNYEYTTLQVIWAIGWSMIILAAIIPLPTTIIALFGLANILLHNLLDTVTVDDQSKLKWLWIILHEESPLRLTTGKVVFVAYPLIPWLGVIALGYIFGRVYTLPAVTRRKTLLSIGLAAISIFVVLRFTNLYGDPVPWSVQKNSFYTWLSFINCNKYPPSLLFLLMTLGPAITLLAFLERPLGAIGKVCLTFGRVPLFYYVLHLMVIHSLALLSSYWQLGHWQWKLLPWLPPRSEVIPPAYGYHLPGVYLAWAITILILWPGCRWFAALKQRSRNPWLSYL